ncbi:hypothetical protein [Escherichia coli]|uniref:hypothetical protein n=1 Tax=Escherichia coli TaxID=562 RepID=UPI000BE9E9DA|nr:hypothetical protein [Escherichia coli]
MIKNRHLAVILSFSLFFSLTTSAADVRIYGFICDTHRGQLFDKRREKIDVIEAVTFNNQFVNCKAESADFKIADATYLMSDEGVFLVDGQKIPREKVKKAWLSKLDH